MSVFLKHFDGYKWVYEEVNHELPKSRVINESHGYTCLKCHSSASRKGIFNFFGQITCDNTECDNSFKQFEKL